jgi:hypothetical protein
VAEGISPRDHARLLRGLIFLVDFINLIFEAALVARGCVELLKDAAQSLRLDRGETPTLHARLDVLIEVA